VKDFRLYLHRSKETNYDAWQYDLGWSTEDPGFEKFKYCGYEVELITQIDRETGRCFAIGIMDRGKLVDFERGVELT
jgi:hypothetical protein